MKTRGTFIFKEIKKKNAGKFTNSQGEEISYNASYSLKVDEITETGIQERIFKIPIESELIPVLTQYKSYTEITIEFDILIYSNSIRIVPTAIIKK